MDGTTLPEQRTSQPALKICGLTQTEQALAIAAMGVDAIGVIGVADTPRFVDATARRNLFGALTREAAGVQRVWVVAEPDDASLAEALAGEGAPSVVQLHGEESPERCSSLKQRYPHVQWWKALRLRSSADLQKLTPYVPHVDSLLLDAWSPDQLGGTGHRLPLEWLAEAELPLPWWLAGGISAEWVPDLLTRVHPHGLDASSRLETAPGLKDLSRVEDLVKVVRER